MPTSHPILEAVFFGKLTGLPEETTFLFARTGLIHLFSASGTHMAAAIWLSHRITGLGERMAWDTRAVRGIQFMLGVLLTTYFGILTEWSSPMVRAYSFATLIALARLTETRFHTAWIFALSLACSYSFGKGSLLSFTLSAAGMAGVLFVRPHHWCTIAIAPWICTLPITLWCFHLFSPLAPIWNLTFGLFISACVLPAAILAQLLMPLGAPGEILWQAAGQTLSFVTEKMALAEAGLRWSFWVPKYPLLAATLFGTFAWMWPRKRVPLIATLLVCAAFCPRPVLYFFDVGQGDSLLTVSANGQSRVRVLTDFGPQPWRAQTAAVALRAESWGIGAVDHVLVTHPDFDHYGGLAAFLARHKVHELAWIREESLYFGGEKVVEPLERAGVPVRFLTSAQAPPGFRCVSLPASEKNDLSPFCEVNLVNGEKALLTGDMSGHKEAELVAIDSVPRAKYLKISHHGSKSSSIKEFLDTTGASVALIGVGRKNRYGHPAPATLGRISESRMTIYRTDRDGTVVFY